MSHAFIAAAREQFRASVRASADRQLIASDDGLHTWTLAQLALEGASSTIAVHLLAAILVTYGELSRIELAVETIPQVRSKTGSMVAFGSYVLSSLLPLPARLKSGAREVLDKRALQTWLHENGARLRWNPSAGGYELDGPSA